MRQGPRPLRLGTAWMASCLALASCVAAPVSKGASPTIDPELAAQLRAMASRQSELERKLDRLEGQLDAMRAAPNKGAPSAKSGPAPTLVPDGLTTVRLGPASAKAPRLPTEVALSEPDEGAMEQMLDPEADSSGDEYGAALKAISTGEVQRGASGLQAFADKHPRDERAPTALLQAGVGLLTFGDPQSAVLAFDRVAQDYPLAKEAPEAMMRLADCQLRLKRQDRAKGVYAQVMSRYPGTPAAKAAEAGLKNLAEGKAAAQ